MPKRTDIKSILIIGAGPIVIGQACEFDYSGTQACKALKEEGYRIVLVNSNPATIMTDPDLADATYIEPITPEIVAKIIEKERPDALLPTMGGQTALNTALSLRRMGVLDKFGVTMIGADADAIDKAEDRELFREAMKKIGLETPKSSLANASDLKQQDRANATPPRSRRSRRADCPRTPSARRSTQFEAQWNARESERKKRYIEKGLIEALEALPTSACPRSSAPPSRSPAPAAASPTTRPNFIDIVERGLDASPTTEVLIEESVLGWKEFEMEVVRDKNDNCIIVCSIENLDPMGVHTGDSITIAPALTLTDKEYQIMRDASIAVLREIGVETGGSNVQFAVNPADGRLVIIEMNPRVSRSSALASKATGFPIAKVAAKLAVGYTLDEIANDITGGATPASFEPTIDYVVTKIPRFAFEKFPGAEPILTTSMKSVGEAMAIGRTFQESLQKALRSLETGLTGLDEIAIEGVGQGESDNERHPRGARHARRPTACSRSRRRCGSALPTSRFSTPARSIRGSWRRSAASSTRKREIRAKGLPASAAALRRLKAMGFSDARLGKLTGLPTDAVDGSAARTRRAAGVQAHRHLRGRVRLADRLHVFDLRDAVRRRASRARPRRRTRRRSSSSAAARTASARASSSTIAAATPAFALQGRRLRDHHDQLQSGDGLDRLRHLRPALFRAAHRRGRAGDHRHRAPQRHAARRDRAVRRPDAAQARRSAGRGRRADPRHLARRHRSRRRPRPLQAAARHGSSCASRKAASPPARSEARAIAEQIGYPIVIRPSYVLGGRAMEIVHDAAQLDRYIARLAGDLDRPSELVVSDKRPLLIDRYLSDAIEVDVDCLADGKDTFIAGIMEHIEEAGIHSGDSACSLPPHSLDAEDDRRARASDPRAGARAQGRRADERAIRHQGRRHLRARGQSARLAHGAVRRQGDRPAGRQDRGAHHGRRNARELRLQAAAASTMSGSRRRCSRSPASPGSIPCSGPEMKSTGEVMGIDHVFAIAFAKSQIGGGIAPAARRHGVRLGAGRRQAPHSGCGAAPELARLPGDRDRRAPSATWPSTAFQRNKVNKVAEGRPHIVDAIKNGEVQLVFNTTEGATALADSRSLRRAALLHKVPYYTTLSGAVAAAQGIKAYLGGDLEVRALQSYFGGKGCRAGVDPGGPPPRRYEFGTEFAVAAPEASFGPRSEFCPVHLFGG